MNSNRFRFVCAALAVLLAAAACNMPFGAPPAPPTDTAAPPTATVTELPTATLTLAVTATDTPTPEPSLTPTAAIPMAEVFKETNCRTGPGQMYDRVVTFPAGTNVEIVARDLGGGYVYVKNPDKPDEFCWLWQNNITISGDITPLPAYTPPPTPTPAPDFEVTFKNFDTCKSAIFARFVITNTGGFAFRSAYVKVTNPKNGEVTENSVNAFDLTVGCVVAQNIAPLGPGGTGYLQSDLFKKDPRGNKLKAVFMLCTEQGLKGACITKTLDFGSK